MIDDSSQCYMTLLNEVFHVMNLQVLCLLVTLHVRNNIFSSQNMPGRVVSDILPPPLLIFMFK